MKEKKNQASLFDQPDTPIKRSTFDMSFPNKMTLNFNVMVPTLCQKTMPGDSWHIDSSVFSRWLAMQAPTFSEYSIKFTSAYVGNSQIWKGWEQFAGSGDDQAARYLLPDQSALGYGDHGQDHEVPYITSASLSRMIWRKVLQQANSNQDGARIAKPYQFAFRLFALPILSLDLQAQNAVNYTTTYDDETFFKYDSISQKVVMCIGSTDDNAFWDEMVARGYVYEMTDMTGPDVALYGFLYDANGLRTHDWCFYCNGANLGIAEKYLGVSPLPAFIELPKNIFFPIEGIDYTVDNNDKSFYRAFTVSSASAVTKHITRYCPVNRTLNCTTQGALRFLTSQSTPFGYMYDILPSELYNSSSDYLQLSWVDLHDRLMGQHYVKKLLGSGTLTDYLGKCYSQSLVRQPFDVANRILGNTVLWSDATNPYGHVAPDEVIHPQGTYNENSTKFEIGVVNDVKISLLPYLAYHKIWSDWIRDPRYELRDFYADPYSSPFMNAVPSSTVDGVGRYREGDCWSAMAGIYDTMYGFLPYGTGYSEYNTYMTPLDDSFDRTVHAVALTPAKPFNLVSLQHLLTMRNRRVVHDFFTMVTPDSQYGEVAESQSTGAGDQDIPTLRLATRFQRFLERSNFVGSDYVKQILTHFGVKPSSCNHCVSQFLGGQVFTPTLSPVTMTSSDTSTQVTGEQSAQMYCSGDIGGIDFKTNEHGYIMQLVTIQNDFFTVDGTDTDPIKFLDYALPEFADLGPEPLPLSRVVNTDGTYNVDHSYTLPNRIFGYIPRYATWKCNLAQIHGDFRKSLSYWVSKRHLNPDLLNGSFGYGKRGNVPEIGQAFLYENPDYNAFVYSGEDFDHALLDIDNKISLSRELPKLPSPKVL